MLGNKNKWNTQYFAYNSTGFSPLANLGFLGSLMNSLEFADKSAALEMAYSMIAPPAKKGQYGFKTGVGNLLTIVISDLCLCGCM